MCLRCVGHLTCDGSDVTGASRHCGRPHLLQHVVVVCLPRVLDRCGGGPSCCIGLLVVVQLVLGSHVGSCLLGQGVSELLPSVHSAPGKELAGGGCCSTCRPWSTMRDCATLLQHREGSDVMERARRKVGGDDRHQQDCRDAKDQATTLKNRGAWLTAGRGPNTPTWPGIKTHI
jgi:hypothetical protein